ncbi:MAG: M23 family metallopeptidase [Candidatus Aminicenantia bacterium]
MKKYYTFMIIPSSKLKARKIILSNNTMRFLLIISSILLIAFTFILVDWLRTSYAKIEVKRLKAENTKQKYRIKSLENLTAELQERINSFKSYAEKLNVFAGLQSPYALKEVGSGGVNSNDVGTLLTSSIQKKSLEKPDVLKKAANEIEQNLKTLYQFFQDQSLRLASLPSIWPTRGYLSGFFGNRRDPFTGKVDFHPGLDIATQLGNKVHSSANGIVIVAEYRKGYGNIVIIDHGFGFSTLYAHLSKIVVKEGQKVKRWDVIGYVGTTGKSTGPHLHYEVRRYNQPLNPLDFILEDFNI